MTHMALSDLGCILLGTIRFKALFCASKKGGIGEGRWVSVWGALHVAAVLTHTS